MPAGLIGRQVVSHDGAWIGEIADTWPLDGGGEPEFVLVRRGRRFRRPAWVPVADAEIWGERLLVVPYERDALEDAPDADAQRWWDPVDIARAHFAPFGA